MTNDSQVPEEKAEEQKPRSACDPQRVLTTVSLMEKGIKQAFLDKIP